MSALPYIIRKEFQQIFRNKVMLPLLFVMPVVQLVVLSFAADFEFKNLNVSVVDHDKSTASRLLISQFSSSGYFKTEQFFNSSQQALVEVEKGNTDMILVVPKDFEKDRKTAKPTQVQLLINAVNNQKAGIASNYAQQVLNIYNKRNMPQFASSTNAVMPLQVTFSEGYWYNPTLDYKTFMVPGILAVLVTMLTAFLSSINIIREKELGTIEQLNVTPISKFEFIVGKQVPFFIIGMFILGIGLTLARLIFGIHIIGSPVLLFAYCAIYVVAILGLGMLVSTLTETQQQAMFVTWFFMVVFILLSGLFTPIDSIPLWAKAINVANPMKYFVEVMRMVMLKGSGFSAISTHFGVMALFAVAFNSLAVLSYKKTN
ncbi:ABC transporter permease subunit [bacterium]|nr:ABC transporter permease subunit [bacterium]